VSVILGPWLFIAERCLITSSQIERELDPLSFKLLNFFITNSTRIIARQELVEQVWQQPFVDDNAINRAISELRKQLGHPEFKSGMIKTHYRKGYSLTVEVVKTPHHANAEQNNIGDNSNIEHQQGSLDNAIADNLIPQSRVELVAVNDIKEANHETLLTNESPQVKIEKQSVLSSTRLLWVTISLVILLCLLASYSLWQNYHLKSNTEQVKEPYVNTMSNKATKEYKFSVTSATWNNGGESNPLVSPQQQYFAYSNIHQGVVKTYVKRLSDQAEVVLNVPNLEVGGISWQQGEQKLLTLLVNAERSECHYVLFDLATFPNIEPPQKIKSCDALKNGYAQLDKKAENLFYTQIDEGFSGSAIYQYDVKKQREKVLVAPSDNRYGSVQVKLSPDGQYLAYLWSQIKSPMKVYIMNLATRETSLLHEFSQDRLHFGLSWFDDSNHIITSESDQLLKININTKYLERIKLPQGLVPFYLALEYDNQVLFSQSDSQQYQLFRGKDLFTNNAPILTNAHESDSSDFLPEASNIDHQLHYFVSKRTGSTQIWRSSKGNLKQITFLDSHNSKGISGLALSPDNKSLLFLQGSSLWLIDLLPNKIHRISELTGLNLIDFKWGAQAHIIYFINVDGDHKKLNRFNLMTRQISFVETAEVSRLYANGVGGVYYLSGKHLVNVTSGEKIAITIPNNGYIFADMSEKYFYGTDALSTLYRMSLDTGDVEHIDTPFKQRNFSILDDESIIFTKRQYKNTSIKRVSWN
jgi:DNA-binding winged helix-turn-helix (wHTH) protein/Tol biopolymer transport system component